MSRKRKIRWHRAPFYIALFLLVVLVIARALLPFWVGDYVNRKLSEMPDYRGHVSAVTLHLWRGAYPIHNVNIEKTTGRVPVPFFSAPLVDLSVQWKALFDGAFVGELDFYKPKMNFVNAPSKANSQVGIDQPWTQTIRQLFPLRINRFGVHDGEIHYRDFSRKPQVDVVMDRIQMVATNLTNSKKLSKSLIAEIQMQGRPLQTRDYRSQIALDPYASKPTFTYRGEVSELPLVKLNEFAKAYASITFEGGTLRVASEMTSKNGSFTGYVEPVFDHMAIFSPQHDADNPINFVWQGIVGGLTRVIRNQPKDRFGTKAPLKGNFDDPKAAVMTTVLNVFRNAFVQAFSGTLQEQKKENLPEVNPDKSD